MSVLRQKWSRGQVEARFANMPPCLIGMEAWVGAHHLSRKLRALGHDARLMPANALQKTASLFDHLVGTDLTLPAQPKLGGIIQTGKVLLRRAIGRRRSLCAARTGRSVGGAFDPRQIWAAFHCIFVLAQVLGVFSLIASYGALGRNEPA
jgi:hypothetical protein